MGPSCVGMCFHGSSLCLEDTGQGKAGKAAHREPQTGVMQRIAVAHAAPRVESLSARGFSSLRRRREKEESWDDYTSTVCLSLCLSACLSMLFSSGCFTQGASCQGFLTQMHLAWAKAVPCRKSLGLSSGKLELFNSMCGFPSFQGGRIRWQVTGLVTGCKQGGHVSEFRAR